MKIQILGSAAGGGYPQWNCNHPNSRLARNNTTGSPQRTQSSIAVSNDEKNWVLFNASPDLRQQINDNSFLHPKLGLRDSPIKSVVVTNADVDHVAGLLNLRESQPFTLYGTNRVLKVLEENTIFNVLNPKYVLRQSIQLNSQLNLKKTNGEEIGITITPFSVPGKVALWLEDNSSSDNFGTVEEDTIAIEVSNNSGEKFFYIPACARMTDELSARIFNSELVFFDGTLWVDDEMIKEKVGVKTGKRMGHMSLSGADGSIEAFKDLDIKRKIFIHINTTNPVLTENTKEREIAENNGWEISYDGMSITI